MKEKLPLNGQDIKKLRKNLLGIILFPFVGAGMLYAFFSVFFYGTGVDLNFTRSFANDKTALYMLMGFSVLFLGFIAYMIWGFAIDLRRGFKYRIEGMITGKKLSVSTSTSHSSRDKTGGSSSSRSTSRYYYIDIEGVEYSIESQHYGKIKVGTQVTMEKAPKSNITLFLEVDPVQESLLEEAMGTNDDNGKFLRSIPVKMPFKPDDIKALKKGFLIQVKFRLIWFLPAMLIALSFVANGMQAFLIFLFPLVLIAGYQLWKFSMEFRQYQRNKQYAYKQGVPAIVEDKSKYSHNGKSTNNIGTTLGYVKVNDQLYEKLNHGDKLILFKPAKGQRILSVMTHTMEEFYLP